MVYRVAVLRLAQESHPLSPELTELGDFERQHYFEGETLTPHIDGRLPEAEGFLKRAELFGFCAALKKTLPDAVIVPILSAWMIPAGPVSRPCFDILSERIVERMRKQGPFDAVMFSAHGAMTAEGMIDPEALLIERIRTVVGSIPIVCTLDLHANMSVEKIATGAYFFGYHTNPHRDHVQTGARAAKLTAKLLSGARPHVAWRTLPMLTGGGTTLDVWPPMLQLYGKARLAAHKQGIDDVTLLMSNPWVGHPDLGWASYVIGERDAAERLANDFAEQLWSVRNIEMPHFPSAEEAIVLVREATIARRFGCVMLHDASDVVTAGSTGDNPRLLFGLLDGAPDLKVLGLLRDPDAVAKLWPLRPGTMVEVEIGGAIDKKRHPRRAMRVHVLSKHDDEAFQRRVVVGIGNARVVLTEGVAFSARPDFYVSAGLDPKAADAVIVKNFFPPLITYVGKYGKAYFVRTEGITDFAAAKELKLNHPVHPFAQLSDWRKTDTERRARPAVAQD